MQANRDGCDRTRDLARDERLAAQWALVIEQDTVRGVIAVSLAIVDGDPVGIELRGPIGAARIKGRGLALRRLAHLAIELRRGCLVEPHAVADAEDADCLKEAQRAEAIRIGRVLRGFEAHLHMALGGQVVDLVGLGLLHQPDDVGVSCTRRMMLVASVMSP